MMPNGTEPAGAPIEWPKVNLGGAQYTVKLSLGALFRLEEMGLDLNTLGQELSSWKAHEVNGETIAPRIKISVLCKILSAAIAERRFLPEVLADMLDISAMPRIVGAIAQALEKIKPPASTVTLREPAALPAEPIQ